MFRDDISPGLDPEMDQPKNDTTSSFFANKTWRSPEHLKQLRGEVEWMRFRQWDFLEGIHQKPVKLPKKIKDL